MRVFVAIAVCAPLGAAFLPGLGQAPAPRRSLQTPRPAGAVRRAAPFAQPVAVTTSTIVCAPTYVGTYYPAAPVSPVCPSAPTGGPATPTVPTSPSGPAPPATGWGPPTPTAPTAPTPPNPAPARRPIVDAPWFRWWNANRWRLSPSPRAPAATLEQLADVVAQLRRVVANDKHFDPQSAALVAMGKLGRAALDRSVAAALSDQGAHPQVRESAALALGLCGAELATIGALVADRARPVHERVHALIGLGLGGRPAGRPVVAPALRDTRDPEVRCAALIAAGLLGGEDWVEVCLRFLGDLATPAPLRAAAAVCLARVAPRTDAAAVAVAALRRSAIIDPEPAVRGAAAAGLREFDDPAAVETMLLVARADPSPCARGLALVSLAEVARAAPARAPRVVVRALVDRWLATREADICGFSVLALGLLADGDPAACAVLRARFSTESNSEIASACAVAVGLARDREAIPLLASQASQPSPTELRGFACTALGSIDPTDERIATYLAEVAAHAMVPELKAAAALALAGMASTDLARGVLRQGLADRNRYFLMSTLVAIGHRRDPTHLEPLWERCRRETNPEARAFAVVAMGCIADPSRIPTLRRLASGYTPEVLGAEYPAIARVLALH